MTDEELAEIGHILHQRGWANSSTMGGMGRRFIEDLKKIGYVIVSKEPTNKMICAALDAWDHGKRSYTEQWLVMVQAGTE